MLIKPLLISLCANGFLFCLDAQQLPPVVLPRVWGGISNAPPGGVLGGCSGHMFGFSGMDGSTNEQANFIGVGTGDGYSLKFCGLKTQRNLTVKPPSQNNTVLVATGDVLVVKSEERTIGDGMLKMVWYSADLLVGIIPPNSVASLENSLIWNRTNADGIVCRVHVASEDALAFCIFATTMSMSWALGRSASGAEAAVRAAEHAVGSVGQHIDSTILERLRPYEALPQEGTYRMLLAKALSVMRVNALAPEGNIKQHWSTPDRTPHRWMWLWDSCYHSVAMNNFVTPRNISGPDLAWEYVKSVLDGADEFGGTAISRKPDDAGGTVGQTQPPLLAWAVWENFVTAKRSGMSDAVLMERLKYAIPRLEGYLQWDIRERMDRTGATPLFVWTLGTESGMDNSQRFDPGKHEITSMLAVDFSVFFAREAQFLSKVAQVVGNTTLASTWEAIGKNVSKSVHDVLWDERSGLYMDKFGPSGFSKVKAVTGLLPMWLDDFPLNRLPQLLDAMHDRRVFGTKAPLPSVARETPTYSTDMWRGPMWLNINYMVAEALLSKSQTQEAIALMKATLAAVSDNYNKYGVIFEFYDSDGVSDPRTLLRKGSRTGGVRDYHWSAALTYNMILKLKSLDAESVRHSTGVGSDIVV